MTIDKQHELKRDYYLEIEIDYSGWLKAGPAIAYESHADGTISPKKILMSSIALSKVHGFDVHRDCDRYNTLLWQLRTLLSRIGRLKNRMHKMDGPIASADYHLSTIEQLIARRRRDKMANGIVRID